ncbi:MAG: hypothetical protein AD742_17380 [Methylibium sp. NZG]|nr:MAG: hypothetical protein AD742_17380 [Methylibium sp. NZG]
MNDAPAATATPADSPEEIVFIVPGQALPAAGGTRGSAGAPTAPAFGGRGTVTQSVQVGARRGAGGTVRLTARPGLDAVVLHITNGPSLMLHPETARDLMLAQAGADADPSAATTRGGAGSADARPHEVAVPAQLSWQGLEQAPSVRGATRGRLGDVLLSAIEVVTGLRREPAAKFSAQKIGAHVDSQVVAGVYALDADAFDAPLKARGTRLDKLPSAGSAPVLVLLHGTFSETQGTFGKLWKEHPQKVRNLFAHYGNRVYGFDHPTLTAGPVDNALMLAQALPDGARVHLLTHSRGGLVAEVLARVCANPALDAATLAPFSGAKYKAQRDALLQLAAHLKGRDIRIERVVRVACPARGTLLASKRMDAYVSVLKWSLELAAVPVAPAIVDFIGEVAAQRTDPAVLPGIEAMTPDSALVQWLHAADATGPLPGKLHVVAGDVQGDSIMSWVKTLLSDAFYWTDNDLVVQTRSMYGGTPRAPSGGQAGASFLFDQGGKVTHFSYFSNPRTADAVCCALMQDAPADFQAIGPMSWAGSSADGLRGARRSSSDKPAAERPAVFLLPGILGSHLAVDGKRVWLGARIIGGLGSLAWREGAGNVTPDGPVGVSYDDLVEFLSASHEVIEFAFDWRRPIEHEARRLADAMEVAIAARATTGQPVRVLAHSMGGLLARTVQLERPDTWKAWLARPGSRLLMVGTPNAGSFAPMQVLSGDDSFGNALAAFGLPFQDHKARQLMAEMPGFIQLQAGLLDESLGLASSARWQALADQDIETVRRANRWHDDETQRNAYRWGVPPQAALDHAVAWRKKMDQQVLDVLPGCKDRILLVTGKAKFTPVGFEVDAREGLVYLDAPDEGDGRVTMTHACLPGVRTWRMDCVHGDMCNHANSFQAFLELLTDGDTKLLPAFPAPVPVGRGSASATHAAPSAPTAWVRSRPSRVRGMGRPPPTGLNALFADRGEPAGASAARNAALRISVHNGNLKFISHTLMLGHYGSMALTGTEHVVDQFIGGAMSASLAAGLYPETPGSHQIFVNTRQSPESPLSLPRPPQVVVAGLGEEGKLRSQDLTRTVRQATLAWAQRVAESPGHSAAHFELAATLIGSGGVGMSVATSAQAVAQGVREANEKLQEGGWPQVSHLRLIELYLDRATDAWRGLQLLVEASPEHFALTPTVLPGAGALRRPLDSGYRGAAYDFISATTDNDEFGEPKIVYTLDTKRARTEVRAQSAQSRLVTELVRRASNDANRDAEIGRTLFQLLVPVEMEANLGGSSEMLLEVDDGTAAIPWEMLDPPDDGRGTPDAPWAIRSKLLRKLRTVEYRQQVSDARIEDAVLIIGEPQADPKKYAPLPGARAEAEAVRDALCGQQGLDASRVRALIATGDNQGPDAAAVTGALLAQRYRIIHIAGHGEPPETVTDADGTERQRLRGVVLSDDTFLGPREVQSMRVVPELAFLNCCHLAADSDKLLKTEDEQREHDRAAFAAGVAKQLIRIGVRCVVAAGWAVEDEAAKSFATAFYRALLGGQRFMDAVHAARIAARAASPKGNTWAAYQCYGDPDWVWRRSSDDPKRQPPPVGAEFANIASPPALALALETLAIRGATRGAAVDAEGQRAEARDLEKVRWLESRFEVTWGGMGAVAEAFGLAFKAASDLDRAVHWYRRAVAANDGSASVKASEHLANLRARLGWRSVERAAKAGKPQAEIQTLTGQGREEIRAAISMLNALVSLAPTIERESLLGSAHKRLALLEAHAGRTQANADAIAAMADHYRRAETLARHSRDADLFYPALNRMGAELLAQAGNAGWGGFDPQDTALVRDSLERKRRDDPDFWSVVGLPELGVYEALASKTLAAQLPVVLAAYDDLHRRAGVPWMWASVADQAGFVLAPYSAGSSAEAKAAQTLLAVLRGYAGR